MDAAGPLSVAVLVGLERGPDSGGHVKCWEHLAAAAAEEPEVDLTVYVLGRPGVDRVAENVRFVALRPVLGSGPVARLVGGVDPSDLAPYHPGLARRLPRHRVWHLTHTMAFTATALRLRRRVARPVVTSLHTDVPFLTEVYTRQVVDGLPPWVRRAVRSTGVERLPAAALLASQRRLLAASDHVLVSNDADRAAVSGLLPAEQVSDLRRGVDTSLFRAASAADRNALTRRYGLPAGVPRVLFVGRVDASKGALLLADAVARLRASGRPAHLVVAGAGAAERELVRRLGGDVTLLGRLSQAGLADVYAGCDVLGFPSRSETAGNVVGEAMSAGLPVLLPEGSRTVRWLADPGRDGVVVPDDDPGAWAAALDGLLSDVDRRRRIGEAARATVDLKHPTWQQVFEDDVLPVWLRLAHR